MDTNFNSNLAFGVDASDDTQERKKESQFKQVLKRLSKKRSAVIGAVVLLIVIIIAILTPYIAPYDYTAQDLYNKNASSSAEHWLGTDYLGRDTLTRLMYGARTSLVIGFGSSIFAMVVGTILGAICGYFGGQIDNAIMRFLDIFQAIPNMLLAITISAVLGSGYLNTIIAISVGAIPGFARMARASCMSESGKEYIEAARSVNASEPRIIFGHVLPNSLSPIIVMFTMRISGSIMAASGLSFIGLGIQPPDAEWGAMVSAGRQYLRTFPEQALYPAFCIMIVVFAINLLGDGLRDALDPKLKN
ncbi:MAG: ABC transporter permease [Oscillospiraceae bacterium]